MGTASYTLNRFGILPIFLSIFLVLTSSREGIYEGSLLNIDRSDPINRAGFGAVEVGGVGFSTSSCIIGARSLSDLKWIG